MASSFLKACLASQRSRIGLVEVIKPSSAYRRKRRASFHNADMQIAF
jgi:hypothetical protein